MGNHYFTTDFKFGGQPSRKDYHAKLKKKENTIETKQNAAYLKFNQVAGGLVRRPDQFVVISSDANKKNRITNRNRRFTNCFSASHLFQKGKMHEKKNKIWSKQAKPKQVREKNS